MAKTKYNVNCIMHDGSPVRIVLSAKNEESLLKQIKNLNVKYVRNIEEKSKPVLHMWNPNAETFTNMKTEVINEPKREGFKGVHKFRNKWVARIHHNKKKIYLGQYDSDIEAAKAYNKKAIELKGENAVLNEV